jgi:hypothetical protein
MKNRKQHKMNVGKESHKEIDFNKLPDPKLHQRVSFFKSGIRIAGYITLPFNLAIGAIILVLSELIGIIEELV